MLIALLHQHTGARLNFLSNNSIGSKTWIWIEVKKIFCGKIQIFQEFYFLNFWTKIGLLHQCASQLHDFWSPFQSFLGLQSTSPTPLSLWRDSQTVQAYLGTNTITKLPSPSSWANRTAASFALSQSYSSGQKSSQNQPQDKEEIMELKRQLAHATQDLHLTKVNLLPP